MRKRQYAEVEGESSVRGEDEGDGEEKGRRRMEKGAGGGVNGSCTSEGEGEKGVASTGEGAGKDASRADDVSRSDSAGAQIPSAGGMRDATDPTIAEIFEAFIDHRRANQRRNCEWIELLERNCESYGGEYCVCNRPGERNRQSGQPSEYIDLHGAKCLGHNISHFLGYYVPRKMCTPSMRDMKRCAATLDDLLKFCIKQGYVQRKDVKELRRSISVSGTFDAEGVQSALQRLHDEGYWERLRAERGPPQQKDDDGYFEYLARRSARTCTKIRENGWEFDSEDGPGTGESSYDSEDQNMFVELPPDVAKLGVEGMELSCMELQDLGLGVWKPVGGYHDEYVCANVYPP